MTIQSFLTAYELIVKGEAEQALVDKTFNDLFERIEGSYLEEDFVKANDKITKLMAIDKAAHYMHSKDPDLLSFAFPEADERFVKDTLDRLSGLEAVAPVRKASRGYFTTFASVEGLEFLQKQVGVLKSNKATREEIKEDVAEYERLFKAGISSHAELLVLSRYYGDKGQRFLDEIKKKAFTADDPMVVGGYASVEVVDKEGHLITTEALTKAFYKFMDSFRTRNVNFAHSDVQAGWPLRVWINQNGDIYKSGVDDKGLYLVSEVRPDITIANKVEKEIEAGVIRSYSIAGSALDKSVETKGNRVIMVVNELELAEISFCLVGTQTIWTKTGLKPIKDIIEGELVLTHTLQWKPVVRTMNRHVSEDLIKITTERGELIATSEHPIRTLVYGGRNVGTNYEWVKIGDLKIGDLVSDHIPVGVCEYCGASIFVPKEGNSGEFRKHCSTECRFKAPGNRTGATLESGDPGTMRQAENHRRLHAEGYLKPWSDEDRAKGEEKRLEALHSVEFSQKRSKLMKEFCATEDGKKQCAKGAIASWQSKLDNPEKLEAWFKAISGSADHYVRGVNHKKTKPEQKIVDLLKSMSLNDWKFTGDGSKSIEGKFPDFSNGDHKIIEVFGDYWHQKDEEIERIKYFNERGYDCLVLWESQIEANVDEVKNTIKEFVGNKLSKVISVERVPYTGLVYNLEVADDNSYVTEFATVHNCEKPVNQESNFDIIKSYPSRNVPGVLLTKAEKQLVGMTDEELKKVGEEAGANFETNIPFDEFKMGMQIEQEHYDLTGMDPLKTAKIALAHIRESLTYYTDLKAHVEKAKDKVVFRENETDPTRPEDSNDIAIKKEYSRLKDSSGSNEQVKQSPHVQTPVTKVGEIHCALDKLNQFLGKDQPPAMGPSRPGLRWDAIAHRWVKPKASIKTKSEKNVLKLINTEKEPGVMKSSTTHITSMKPEKRESIKVTWGKKSVSEDDMANLAAFLDFMKDQDNG